MGSAKRASATVVTYRPFIIGVALVLACTCGLAQARPTTNAYEIMNAFMGCFFIIFALPKFINISAFAAVFRQYDLISKLFPLYARIFPFVELTLGIVLLATISSQSMTVNFSVKLVVAILSGLGIIGVIRSLRLKKDLNCACLGSAIKLPLSKVAAAENGLMFVMAISMLVMMHPFTMVML